MNTKLKRSYPFESSLVLTSKNKPLGVSQVPLHKKMTMTPPAINVTSHVPGSPSWPTIVTTGTKRDNYSNHNNYIQNMPTPTIDSAKQPTSTPVSKGRKNMKNLQLVVPPVRSSISAPSSPQLSQISGTHTHNRRPSTPICVYQNKPSEHSTKLEADPMALISRTENEIDEESPYKDGPICILPNLYLGTEINAANRPMLQRMNVEYILNVGKEVVVPYMDEIAGYTSVYKNRDIKTYTDNQLSPGLSISSSVSSEHSYQTATSSPLAQSPNFDSSMPSSPTFALTRSNSFKRSSLTSSRPQSMSFQLAQKALTSGNVLTVPATHEFRQLKYKKFFWTHNQENLITDFTPAFDFIDEARSAGKNVLVHCQCGVSRSASLIIGYVMKANRMTLNQAYEFVKNRSSYISPNMSLVYQLVDFEKTLKLNGNNNNTNGSSASKNGAEPVRSHSRSSSIESDLLLKSHRRSSSFPRSNTNVCVSAASHSIDSPPRTPGPSDSLSCTNQQQATIKGEPGRFHVITAAISTLPVSPSVSTPSTASPTSNSISPTSSKSSPTTPTTDELTNIRTSHSSRPVPSTKTSQSSLLVNSCKNFTPHSPSRSERTPPTLNTPLSPTLPNQKQSISSNSSTISLALPEFNLENANISLLSYPSRISTIIPNHHSNSKGNGGVQNSGFFTLDSIFSPTRTASPIRSPSFSDLWGESD